MIWRYHDLREDVLKALELVSPEQARPYVLETIEIFGSDRAMVASNFPTDKLFGSFDRHLGAYDAITADFSADERNALRAEEHTSELQSLMRISNAVFCLKTKTHI